MNNSDIQKDVTHDIYRLLSKKLTSDDILGAFSSYQLTRCGDTIQALQEVLKNPRSRSQSASALLGCGKYVHMSAEDRWKNGDTQARVCVLATTYLSATVEQRGHAGPNDRTVFIEAALAAIRLPEHAELGAMLAIHFMNLASKHTTSFQLRIASGLLFSIRALNELTDFRAQALAEVKRISDPSMVLADAFLDLDAVRLVRELLHANGLPGTLIRILTELDRELSQEPQWLIKGHEQGKQLAKSLGYSEH